MKNLVVVGAQWGDEGKGKVVDLLCERFDIVARYQGGHNAGHTVKAEGRTFVLHLVPTGIIHPGKVAVIGHGLVVDPEALITEISELRSLGIDVTPERLRISRRAHLILPYHRAMEAVMEERRGKQKVGTTMRGIGPAYVDKVGRCGVRVGDLLDPVELQEKLAFNVATMNRILQTFGATAFDATSLYAKYVDFGHYMAPFITDTITYLNDAISQGQSVLFEGAQGTLLDVDCGTYPYVTSSSVVVAGAAVGTGVPLRAMTMSLGVMKAYTTRVGEGPFPTELEDETGRLLQTQGVEFGASTGRIRRCGWFDAVAARYAMKVNGFDTLAVTKLDVLDAFDELKICVGYEHLGQPVSNYPNDPRVLSECVPVYESLPGWKSSTTGMTQFEQLPRSAQNYLHRLSRLVGCELSLISTGASRNEAIVIPDSPLARLLGEAG